MSNTTLIDSLNIIQLNILHYCYPSFYIIGTIGNLFNIFILSQRTYRQNSCSFYIFSNTFINLIGLHIFFLNRCFIDLNIDLIRTSFYCKFRLYSFQAVSALSRIYALLACIDRWAMTSRKVQIRSFAQIKFAKILIPFMFILWCLITIHTLIYQDIVNGQCISTSKTYTIFYNIYNTIMTGFLIPVSMIIFSLLCIKNVKNIQRRVYVNGQNTMKKKTHEYQLIIMILIQQFAYLITNIPFTMNLSYVLFTLNMTKSNLHLTIDNFINSIVQLLVFLNFSLTFYIYILTSSTFRKDLKQLLMHNYFIRKLF